jgi:hypothetical protein
MTKKYTYNNHKIYKNNEGQFIVKFRWGDQPGENLNHFRQLKLAKSFIDRIIIEEYNGISPVKETVN